MNQPAGGRTLGGRATGMCSPTPRGCSTRCVLGTSSVVGAVTTITSRPPYREKARTARAATQRASWPGCPRPQRRRSQSGRVPSGMFHPSACWRWTDVMGRSPHVVW